MRHLAAIIMCMLAIIGVFFTIAGIGPIGWIMAAIGILGTISYRR